MRRATDPGEKPELAGDLWRFLILYLGVMFGALLLVHVLQPEREGGSSSRSPGHQEQRATERHTLAAGLTVRC
jgi:hypothetical protein